MGEGGIPRKEFYEELDWWEAIRIYNGIMRRYRVIQDTSRTRDFMYLSAHWDDKKNGELPKTAQEWCPHSWDPRVSEEYEKKEYEASMALLRELNAKQANKTE